MKIYDIIDPFIFNNNINDVDFKKFDSVIIATPLDTHYLSAKLCIENNKHILIEKPCTHNLNDIQKLIKIDSTKNIGVGYVLLYCSGIQKIKTIKFKMEKCFFQ